MNECKTPTDWARKYVANVIHPVSVGSVAYMSIVNAYTAGWKAAQRAARKTKPRNTRSKK